MTKRLVAETWTPVTPGHLQESARLPATHISRNLQLIYQARGTISAWGNARGVSIRNDPSKAPNLGPHKILKNLVDSRDCIGFHDSLGSYTSLWNRVGFYRTLQRSNSPSYRRPTTGKRSYRQPVLQATCPSSPQDSRIL